MRSFIWLLVIIVALMGCQPFADAHYSPSRSDVVDIHGKTTNVEKFSEFYKHVKEGKNGYIRIVKYTIEGDPILYDLSYDGKTLKSTIDNTRDQYGGGIIIINRCKSIETKTTDESTKYFLTGCSSMNSDTPILEVFK